MEWLRLYAGRGNAVNGLRLGESSRSGAIKTIIVTDGGANTILSGSL